MPYEILDRDARLKNDGRPKRILARDVKPGDFPSAVDLPRA
jgi:hypothetical protein